MEPTTHRERVAVLIDSDNISRTRLPGILAETARHGTLSVKRAYGDWAGQQLSAWRPDLAKHAIQPMQQFAYVTGKNATDAALIIDAMDLLYANEISVFCLISSDSDFTRLAIRLREAGRRVYGIGARHTHEAFTNACDRFTYFDLLPGAQAITTEIRPRVATEAAPLIEASAPEVRDPSTAFPVLQSAITATAGDDGWAYLAAVGQFITNTEPTFDARAYGHPKLGSLVRAVRGLDVQVLDDALHAGHLKVRISQDG